MKQLMGSKVELHKKFKRSLLRSIEGQIGGLLKIIHYVPHCIRAALLTLVYWTLISISSRYRKIAYRNIEQVFPNMNRSGRRALLWASARPFARMVSDLLRISSIDSSWFEEHVVVERLDELRSIVSKQPVLYLGGHIGSFDLMIAAFGKFVQPIDFIVRESQSPAVEEWSTKVRTRFGNGVIPRSGGLRKILSRMIKGRSVGFLFDQNVTRNNAVFVDWFGRLAATTVAPGLVAERLRCPVIILSARYEGSDRYIIRWHNLDHNIIYDNGLSVDEVRKKVTSEAVKALEKIIREQPEDWFWLHRRWKTSPEGMPEDFY
jgi:KDO2-lipid IV(A) lauroyltransferase